MGSKRTVRRVRYSPEEVVLNILSRDMYFRIASIVFSSDRPLHATEIVRVLEKRYGIRVSHAHVYTLLRRMEKWGVVEGVKDPLNGKIMFKPSTKKVARMLQEGLGKRKAEELSQMITDAIVDVYGDKIVDEVVADADEQ